MIDWDVAVATGVRWARPGPQVSLAEARRAVAELRELAAVVQEPVREVTGLVSREHAGQIAVVDRPGWIRANVDGFRVVLDPLAQQLRERPGAWPAAGGLLGSVGSRFTGVQMGLILAFLAGRVLGQYELFLPPDPDAKAAPGAGRAATANGTAPGGSAGPDSAGQHDRLDQGDVPAGRLTLVAPNIVMVERELGVQSRDFRLWVCLHEETHRMQFTAVPWLRGYVQGQISEFLLASDLDPAAVVERLRAAADVVSGAVRGGGGGGESLIEAIQSPRQRATLDRLTAVMTLVEGHGDYVMDAAGPQVVPSVAEIRARFAARRHSAGRMEQALRRLLGIDLKLKQYAEGARFVRSVVDEVGMAGFNKVWTSPQTLPTKAEIARPSAWVNRVIGTGALPPSAPPPASPPGEPGGQG
ncbi:MAG TPA: zinc-dependent metalloprotease [Streptosporangiaceae bacterium]|nr:zinc-dependent metalloprotease [Streptosporangiaceae bacterium]